jgi:hypothetical protein
MNPRLVVAAVVLAIAGSARGAGDQAPTRAPACEQYKISGPTVIAFFKYDGCQDRPNCEDALDDFQYYLDGLRRQLDESAIRQNECYGQSFEVEVRGQSRRVGPAKVLATTSSRRAKNLVSSWAW